MRGPIHESLHLVLINLLVSLPPFFGGGGASPNGMQDLSSLTRNRICAPCSGSAES